jgi:predicted SAM-dependent methyltransferase
MIMASNKWKKRVMKVKGWLWRTYSYLLLRYTRWNTRKLQDDIAKRGIDKLHVGCGLVLLDGWLNILYEPRQEYGRIQNKNGKFLLNYNLLKKWPVNDNAISFIAGSHFIEHLDLNHGIAFLKESFRVMKPGGTIRLSCPDLGIYIKNYVENNTSFYQHKLIREWCAFSQAETPGEILVAKAYDSGGAHKWFYDFDSLKHILGLSGFQNVKKCQRLEGSTPGLDAIELPGRELETVYVEAKKP